MSTLRGLLQGFGRDRPVASEPAFLQLFDRPGPVASSRTRRVSIVASLAVAVLVAAGVRRFADAGQLDWESWSKVLEWPSLRFLLGGLGSTLLAAAGVVILGGTIGLVLAVARSNEGSLPARIAAGYIEIARTVPVLLLIYVFLFVLPGYGINLPLYWKLVVPLTITSAAAFAEIIRAGILSVARGQSEAGFSLGMRRRQVMRKVVLPQALRRVVPSLVSQTVGTIKDTSLGFVVSYTELLYTGRVLSTFTGELVQTYVVVALMFFTVDATLSAVARRLERRTAPARVTA